MKIFNDFNKCRLSQDNRKEFFDILGTQTDASIAVIGANRIPVFDKLPGRGIGNPRRPLQAIALKLGRFFHFLVQRDPASAENAYHLRFLVLVKSHHAGFINGDAATQ